MGTKTQTGKTNSVTYSQKKTDEKTSTSASGKKQKTLDQLFEEGLKDVYSAETQLLEALPQMAKAAYEEELQDAFENHFHETQRHVDRLGKIFSKLGIEKDNSVECEAMKGLITEGQEIIRDYEEGHVRDSALIIGAQKIEHYEIASYGSLCELADVLGYHNIHDLLGRTLDEEENTDNMLSEIASYVNDKAMEFSEQEEKNGEKKEYETA